MNTPPLAPTRPGRYRLRNGNVATLMYYRINNGWAIWGGFLDGDNHLLPMEWNTRGVWSSDVDSQDIIALADDDLSRRLSQARALLAGLTAEERAAFAVELLRGVPLELFIGKLPEFKGDGVPPPEPFL